MTQKILILDPLICGAISHPDLLDNDDSLVLKELRSARHMPVTQCTLQPASCLSSPSCEHSWRRKRAEAHSPCSHASGFPPPLWVWIKKVSWEKVGFCLRGSSDSRSLWFKCQYPGGQNNVCHCSVASMPLTSECQIPWFIGLR